MTDEKKKYRIVVMGGSFNPPTLAHLRLMLAAVEAVGAEKGLFVPSNHEYVRKKMLRQRLEGEVLSEDLRAEMLTGMCAEDSRLGVDTCEFGREPGWRTFETMEAIQTKYPEAELYFVAGSDKLRIIPRWHRSKEFLQSFKLLVARRDGTDPEEMIRSNPFLNKHADAFVFFTELEGLEDISSTHVRKLLSAGDASAEEQVHPAVWELLKEGWSKMDITSFRGDYDFLSNFYAAPVEYGGLMYQNAEAAFQAQKCLDPAEREQFCELPANKAKRLGRQVELRSGWEEIKTELMLEIVRAKFTQNPVLAARLLATGARKLVEGNTWKDVFWGVDLRTGEGENHLGQILMQVREELKGNGKENE